MQYLNTRTSVLHRTEYIASKPVARATWCSVSLWCAIVENGGRISGAKAWSTRQWQQTCGVTLREVNNAAPLLAWHGVDLIVWEYPGEQERVAQAKRATAQTNGQRGGRPTTKPTKVSHAEPTLVSHGIPESESVREGKGREVCVPDHTHTDLFSLSRDDALARLAPQHPGLNLAEDFARAEVYVRKLNGPGATCSVEFFVRHWLPKCLPRVTTGKTKPAIPPEPEYWREMVNDEFPNVDYARGGPNEGRHWDDLDVAHRDRLLDALPAWLKRTGRVAA